ncbi:MAG: hypothetical protein HYV07_24375 [Deltaproteobacteria bacterium]|nr:hypothetical protein [Deltaproteobacteria bacterium]
MPRRELPVAKVTSGLLLLACAPSTARLSSDADFAIAVVHREGAATRAVAFEPTKPTDVRVEDSESLAVFEVQRGDFATDAAWSELRFEPDVGSRDCEVCPLPATHPPQLLGPGDRCLLPRFLPARDVDGTPVPKALANLVASGIAMSLAGQCPRATSRVPARVESNLRFISPETDPDPAEAAASSSRGTLVVSERMVSWVGNDGARRSLGRDEVPFRGPIRSILALADGAFLVASVEIGAPAGTQLTRIEDTLELSTVSLGAYPISLSTWELSERGAVLVGELNPGQLIGRGGILDCALGPTLDCEVIVSIPDVPAFGSVALLGGGRFAALGGGRIQRGTLAPGGADLEWVPVPPQILPWDLAALDSRLFVCADDLDRGGGGVVLEAVGDQFNPVLELSAAGCRRMHSLGPDRAVVSFADGQIALLTPSGSSLLPELTLARTGAAARMTSGPGLATLTGWDGRAHVARTTSTGISLDLVYGAPSQSPSIDAISTDGERFHVFSENPSLVRTFDGSGELVESQPISFPAPMAITHAAFDTRDRTHLVAGWVGPRPSLARVGADGVGLFLQLPNELIAIRDLVEVRPGVVAIAGTRSQLWLVDGASVRSVLIDWDDPYSAIVETAPTPLFPDEKTDEGALHEFRSIAISGGVGWIAGTHATLARSAFLGATPYAERVLLPPELRSTDDSESRRPTVLARARALSATHVLFAADELNDQRHSVPRMIEGRSLSATSPLLTEYPYARPPARVTDTSAGEPRAVFGTPETPAVLTVDGANNRTTLNFLGSPEAFVRLASRMSAAAESSTGVILLGSKDGRMALITTR